MKTEEYGKCLSDVYDALNGDIDYNSWADFLEKCFEKYCKQKVSHVCEIACGTGTMSVELEKRGYRLTSSDLSERMLCVADNKARNAGCKNIVFTKQNMCCFTTATKAQAVICLLDSINCLTGLQQVKQCFECANKVLEQGGVFLFDVNSKQKFESVYADNAYVLENDGVLCAWQNEYNQKSKICKFYLSFFVENNDGSYERYDELIREKMYTQKTLKKYLDECGFDVAGVFSDYDFGNADENKDERLYFVAVKR